MSLKLSDMELPPSQQSEAVPEKTPSIQLHWAGLAGILEPTPAVLRGFAAFDRHDVHVWTVPLPENIPARLSRQWLFPDEQERAADMVSHAARHFMAARMAVRGLLAGILDQNPQSLVFASNPWGKPELVHSGIHFNVSHSGRFALIALSFSHEVGVDLEAWRPVPEALDIARSWFDDAEAEWVAAARGKEQAARFLRLWVIREAWVKAMGTGLSTSLDSFAVRLPEHFPNDRDTLIQRPEILVRGVPSKAMVHEAAFAPGCAGALVALVPSKQENHVTGRTPSMVQ